jgi:hypothetical protein
MMGPASMEMLPPALPQQQPLSVSPTPAFSQSNPAGTLVVQLTVPLAATLDDSESPPPAFASTEKAIEL